MGIDQSLVQKHLSLLDAPVGLPAVVNHLRQAGSSDCAI